MEASDYLRLPRGCTSRRKAAIRLGASYAAGLTSAHILAAGAVSLMIVLLTRNTGGDTGVLSSRKNLIALCGLVAISASVGGVAGVLNMVPSFRWFADGSRTNARSTTRGYAHSCPPDRCPVRYLGRRRRGSICSGQLLRRRRRRLRNWYRHSCSGVPPPRPWAT